KSGLVFDANFEHPTLQGAIATSNHNPGRCPGLCVPLGFQPVFAAKKWNIKLHTLINKIKTRST
uniref:hypothetical protein n=1 Tax=Alloprevotella sp. TaxID=1872471 RepID=UPI003FF13EB9